MCDPCLGGLCNLHARRAAQLNLQACGPRSAKALVANTQRLNYKVVTARPRALAAHDHLNPGLLQPALSACGAHSRRSLGLDHNTKALCAHLPIGYLQRASCCVCAKKEAMQRKPAQAFANHIPDARPQRGRFAWRSSHAFLFTTLAVFATMAG